MSGAKPVRRSTMSAGLLHLTHADFVRMMRELRTREDHRERAYLQTLQWNDEQLRRYRGRIVGIERRAERVWLRKLGHSGDWCPCGSSYGVCRTCPPWRYVGTSDANNRSGQR